MISLPHTEYFYDPFEGKLSINIMMDLARGWAVRHMHTPGDIHFLSFAETPNGRPYTSGILIRKNETDFDLEWIGSCGTEVLLTRDVA